MSDWHFGIDYDMWLYPPVNDYDYELPEPIEAANIEGTLLINAEDAIEQVRRLQAENAKLRELCSGLAQVIKNDDDTFRRLREIAEQELSYDFIGMYDSSLGEIDQITRFIDSMAELGIEAN